MIRNLAAAAVTILVAVTSWEVWVGWLAAVVAAFFVVRAIWVLYNVP